MTFLIGVKRRTSVPRGGQDTSCLSATHSSNHIRVRHALQFDGNDVPIA